MHSILVNHSTVALEVVCNPDTRQPQIVCSHIHMTSLEGRVEDYIAECSIMDTIPRKLYFVAQHCRLNYIMPSCHMELVRNRP